MVVINNVSMCIRNVERLISRCEDIIGDRVSIRGQKWRIPKYVQSLNEMISELDNRHSSSVNTDQLRSFKQRVSIIEEVLRQNQQTRNSTSSTTTTTTGTTTTTTTTGEGGEPESLSCTSTPVLGRTQHQRSLDDANVHGSGLLRRTLTRNYKEMREELFSKEDSFSSPRLPTGSSQGSKSSGSVETVLAKEQELQENIAQDMILMARSLKSHSMAARDIIKSDKEVLAKTIDQTDSNIEGINRETGRLKEKNRSCSWGVWMLLAIVFVVFILMILFIRMFPKRR